MLVLSRHSNESIVFTHAGVSFEVMVGEVSGSRVKILVDAPESVLVLRKEIVNDCAGNSGRYQGNKEVGRADQERPITS